jgi:hypothetical protein
VLYTGDRLFNESKIVVKQFLGSYEAMARDQQEEFYEHRAESCSGGFSEEARSAGARVTQVTPNPKPSFIPRPLPAGFAEALRQQAARLRTWRAITRLARGR